MENKTFINNYGGYHPNLMNPLRFNDFECMKLFNKIILQGSCTHSPQKIITCNYILYENVITS